MLPKRLFLYLLPSDNRLDFLCSTEVLGVLARRLPDDGIRILSFELSPAGGSFRRLPVDPGSGLRAQIRVGAGCLETCVVGVLVYAGTMNDFESARISWLRAGNASRPFLRHDTL